MGGPGGLRMIQSKEKLSCIRMGPRSIFSESLRKSYQTVSEIIQHPTHGRHDIMPTSVHGTKNGKLEAFEGLWIPMERFKQNHNAITCRYHRIYINEKKKSFEPILRNLHFSVKIGQNSPWGPLRAFLGSLE